MRKFVLIFATPATRAAIQKLFDDATASFVAPGYQFVVFDRDAILVNGVSGYSRVPSPAGRGRSESGATDGVKMRPDHIHWIMSASKLALSVAALIALEKGHTSNGMTIADLDDHDKLVEILPEFKLGGDSLVTKVIEGWEEDHDELGRKIPKLRNAKTPVTLRMLFTHSTGLGYFWDGDLDAQMFFPFDGSVPLKKPFITGLIDAFTVPAVVEPGTKVQYGSSTDWLGQWLVRSTGCNLREIINSYILEPLKIPAAECDVHLRGDMLENMSSVYFRTGDPQNRFQVDHSPPSQFTCEGMPPAGYAHLASIPLMASTQAYSILLQAVLKHDIRLMSEEMWTLAEEDALAGTDIKIPVPRVPTALPNVACELKYFSAPVDPTRAGTMNLLNTELALGPTESGRPAGSYGWTGLRNSYYMIDPINGFGYMWSSQCGPWASPEALALRDDVEKILYHALSE
ncbi:beta-lactamase/transpeptidase-like protein [Clavulina sp. PMI_390]|nr:beta-lactamase/transpeptidase-like protein [Clavulina sp. PMI_390]